MNFCAALSSVFAKRRRQPTLLLMGAVVHFGCCPNGDKKLARSGRPGEPDTSRIRQMNPVSGTTNFGPALCGAFCGLSGFGTPWTSPRCVPMNSNTTTKAIKTAEELTAALNKAIQAHPECQGIKLLKLTALVDSQGIANWDAEFAADPGVTISADSRACCSERNSRCKNASIWRVRADAERRRAGLPVEGPLHELALFAIASRGWRNQTVQSGVG